LRRRQIEVSKLDAWTLQGWKFELFKVESSNSSRLKVSTFQGWNFPISMIESFNVSWFHVYSSRMKVGSQMKNFRTRPRSSQVLKLNIYVKCWKGRLSKVESFNSSEFQLFKVESFNSSKLKVSTLQGLSFNSPSLKVSTFEVGSSIFKSYKV
jgi:hypothetical protein